MFKLIEVSKKYSKKTILYPISTEIPLNQSTVIIGPSGSGKSTLLNILTGLVKPSSGVLKFRNKKVVSDNFSELRQLIGYVPQNKCLFPHLTIFENVVIMAKHLNWSREKIAERVALLRDLTKFSSKDLNQYPHQLSGGQKQRVSIMRALMLDPEVILLDEPLGALDPLSRNELQTDLRKIFLRLSKTVILVTHDIGEAVFLGNHFVIMKNGHMLQTGSFDDLIDNPQHEFVTKFLNAQRSIKEVYSETEELICLS